MIREENIAERLVKEFGYPAIGAQVISSKLAVLSPSVRVAFEDWWISGAIPELKVEEFDVQRLAKEKGMNTIAALLTLDWLVRDPDSAKHALARKMDTVR